MVELWPRIFSGIAVLALLIEGGINIIRLDGDQKSVGRVLFWAQRATVSIGVGALLLSLLSRGAAGSLFTDVGDRAVAVALVAVLLRIVARSGVSVAGQFCVGWASLIPSVLVATIGVVSWPAGASSVSLLLLFTLVAAGIGLWDLGRWLDALIVNCPEDGVGAAALFAAITLNVAIVGAVNWRVWGTPAGPTETVLGHQNAVLNLLAIWLISAAGVVLTQASSSLARVLDLATVGAILVVALSVRWALPFG